MEKVVFVGAGSMAEAMIQGWIEQNVVDATQIYITNRSNYERLDELSLKYGVNILQKKEELFHADIIVLAVKPKDGKVAMESISSFIAQNTPVLSVMAGISINAISNLLGNRPIARVMPNTSATIGMSASGVAFNEDVNEDLKKQYLQMLDAIGIVIEVEEEKLHAVTALSGSGPAYLYYLLEAWEKVGTEFGLSKETVRKLMVQTIAGSAAMLQQIKEEPDVLRKKVTSPGGTTEAGIQALESHHFNEAIYQCIKSAEARSRELAKGE
ncbi:pyrroline-5-carboxylate reductase [Ureibacillus massiliensis 4400831 = CIP 108448 = CCUG 49529]|uniref:Pyrroline-5-carboxylate reductase n=1 Tax=Ureibacillus massiliensis 4400831 = CIP 108448 = CCUG 49529 TaxID=1211035 RepID=A0A0A3J2R0_9BACL|nr:pyrroline-5-carboxylate reductase [Ureibacillus massiliensis]KGR90020.1 pyrroline-5-carboxylate reductase [Ureibacillus massiliensis 4400831 = CIP 108448 = CCUG 49529]